MTGTGAVEPNERDEQEYRAKWREEREVNRIPEDEPTVLLEVSVANASSHEGKPVLVTTKEHMMSTTIGTQRGGRHPHH